MPELTFEEIERMRQIVQQHDAQRPVMQTIDLNNPPKVPYTFQKFPMMVYGESGQNVLVRSESELQEALESGWTRVPQSAPVPVEQPLSPQYQVEVNRLNEQLEAERRKRGPGRPRSTEAA